MSRAISRRQALGALGTVSLGTLLAACGSEDKGATSTRTTTVTTATTTSSELSERFDASATCTQTAELTEGPFYFDVDALRSDIRENREGTTLRLGIRVRDAAACDPIANALVDIWHCDAVGQYSGVDGDSGARYLRGTQATNAGGIAEFLTIYPGAYRGRTPHIHGKVHLDRQTVLTTQLFFDDDVSGKVYARAPYAGNERDTSNDDDGIFDPSLVLTLSEEEDGYLGLMTFDVRSG